jgi:hypothetical protein
MALGNSKIKAVPAKVSKILHAHLDKPPFLLNFSYQSVICKLNYLAQTTRPDIVYATHKLAKYSSNPREPHGEAVLYLIHYLKKTQDLGTCFKPESTSDEKVRVGYTLGLIILGLLFLHWPFFCCYSSWV